jgi:hypothetical protein
MSEETASNIRTVIYVRLLNEGTEVSRPTEAVAVGAGLFKILATPDYDPEDEKWEFPPGSIVRRRRVHDSAGEHWVAVGSSTSPIT